MPIRVDFTVIIPTYRREVLVEKLLSSLNVARNQYLGHVEILVIDSSEGDVAKHIQNSCERFGALYIKGKQSVRAKRNEGAQRARNPVLLFIDSDCIVSPDIFTVHASAYNSGIKNLGGVFGVTRFVGNASLAWKVVELTPFLDVFSFAERFPFVPWVAGNNFSIYKQVFDRVGGFDEDFPFRLGGDDFDLGLRVNAFGFLIKSEPRAITYHTRDTWRSWIAVTERAWRWGRMEYYVRSKNPKLVLVSFPRIEAVAVLFLLCSLFTTILQKSFLALLGFAGWLLLYYNITYLVTLFSQQSVNPFYFLLARLIEAVYQLGCIIEHIRHRRFDVFYRGMIIATNHIKMIWSTEVQRIWAMLLASWALMVFHLLR